MLKRIKIHRFPLVQPGTELTFNPRMNVLLGRNGSGKTTLLDLISRVIRFDFSDLRQKPFDLEFEHSHEFGQFFCRFSNHREYRPTERTAPIDVAYGSPADSDHLFIHRVEAWLQPSDRPARDRLLVEIVGSALSLRVESELEPSKVESVLDPFGSLVLLRIFSVLSTRDADGLLQYSSILPIPLGTRYCFRFDESLQMFESVTSYPGSQSTSSVRFPVAEISTHYHISVESPRSGSRSTSYINGVPFHINPPLDPPGPGQNTVELPLSWPDLKLLLFPKQAGLESITMTLGVLGSSMEEDRLWWRFGGASFQFRAPGDTLLTHRDLSYGQKRLLSFLYYLDCNPHFAIADELVNGMHHDWISFCLDELRTRQAFLTSQNPLLLDQLAFDSVEEVKGTFIQCRADQDAGGTRFRWTALSDEDAGELYADYGAGIQHVGELLRLRGLW